VILCPTGIAGVAGLLAEPVADARGRFVRTWCAEELAAGLDFRPFQVSLRKTARAITLRGLHWQAPPTAQHKLTRCLRGAVLDVAVDLRPDSPTDTHCWCHMAARMTSCCSPRMPGWST
jgi:dTDP-4-dehydrorhamnose 3,5-epimerase